MHFPLSYFFAKLLEIDIYLFWFFHCEQKRTVNADQNCDFFQFSQTIPFLIEFIKTHPDF